MKKIIACFLLLLAYLPAQAQDKKTIDSLQKVYNNLKNNNSRILALIEIAYVYRENNPDTTLFLAGKALQEAQKSHYQNAVAWAWDRMGAGYNAKSDYPKALEYYEKALTIFEKTAEKKGIGSSLTGMGNVHSTTIKLSFFTFICYHFITFFYFLPIYSLPFCSKGSVGYFMDSPNLGIILIFQYLESSFVIIFCGMSFSLTKLICASWRVFISYEF